MKVLEKKLFQKLFDVTLIKKCNLDSNVLFED